MLLYLFASWQLIYKEYIIGRMKVAGGFLQLLSPWISFLRNLLSQLLVNLKLPEYLDIRELG
jgi:hypothetical protein